MPMMSTDSPRLGMRDATVYWAGFIGEHYFRQAFFGGMRHEVEARLLRRQLAEAETLEIPRVDPRETPPAVVRRDYLDRNVPVVLSGAAASWPAVERWTPEFFKARYGNDVVSVRVRSSGVGADSLYFKEVTMSELVENVLGNGEYYANNLEDFFNDNPELREDLLIHEAEAFSSARPHAAGKKRRNRIARKGEILSTQVFISNANGRTGYHCAWAGNFFVQVHGRKRWVFVDPRHTPFMYPVVRKDFVYSGSSIDHRLDRDAQLAAGHGLYTCVPKYTTVLEPGDVLFSPQWWWHTVDNLSTSIGVAMRFRTSPFAGNPIYSAMTLLSPTLWRHAYQVFKTGWGTDRTGAKTFFEREGSNASLPQPHSDRSA